MSVTCAIEVQDHFSFDELLNVAVSLYIVAIKRHKFLVLFRFVTPSDFTLFIPEIGETEECTRSSVEGLETMGLYSSTSQRFRYMKEYTLSL